MLAFPPPTPLPHPPRVLPWVAQIVRCMWAASGDVVATTQTRRNQLAHDFLSNPLSPPLLNYFKTHSPPPPPPPSAPTCPPSSLPLRGGFACPSPCTRGSHVHAARAARAQASLRGAQSTGAARRVAPSGEGRGEAGRRASERPARRGRAPAGTLTGRRLRGWPARVGEGGWSGRRKGG